VCSRYLNEDNRTVAFMLNDGAATGEDCEDGEDAGGEDHVEAD